MDVAKIEAEIRAFFDEAAESKLETEHDGALFDHDSNWGFHPRVLAERIVALLAVHPAEHASR